VGRCRGLGLNLGVGVTLGVPLGVAVAVGVALGAGVTVGVAVAVGLAVGVAVGVGVGLGVPVGVGVGVGVPAGPYVKPTAACRAELNTQFWPLRTAVATNRPKLSPICGLSHTTLSYDGASRRFRVLPLPVQSEASEAILIPLKQPENGSHWMVS
jgi:hypothetical protein